MQSTDLDTAPDAASELTAVPDPAELPEDAEVDAAGAGVADEYTASVWPGENGIVPTAFAEAVLQLETLLDRPVWLLVHQSFVSPYPSIDRPLRDAFFAKRNELQNCPHGVALVIDSGGGDAGTAYQIATLFRRHCGGFTAIVPRWAKSAATLLSLGGRELYMGRDAELGPIDVQVYDVEQEAYASALDEVQALERLNSVALDLADQAMFLLVGRTGKKVDALLPHVLKFTSDVVAPLLDKIDTVHYTGRSRVLKVAEDYATRLLGPRYSEDVAKTIARRLVNNYSEHGFVLDREEVGGFLALSTPDEKIQAVIDDLEDQLTFGAAIDAFGRIERKGAAGATDPDDI